LRYDAAVNTQTALKLLFELRAVLDRLGENDSTIQEALAHDIDRAMRLTDSCIAQLTEDSPDADDADNDAT